MSKTETMRSGLTLFTVLGFAAASCGNSDRHFGSNAGTGGQGDVQGGASGSAGRAAVAGNDGRSPADAGAAGTQVEPDNAGAAGTTDEPDPCRDVKCDSAPDAATCKDTNTLSTYDSTSGTCNAGGCKYTPVAAPCPSDTPKCKATSTSAKCVACLTNTDCSNGGSCSSANVCVCSNRFNGPHCEFQLFRALGMLENDGSSGATNLSHDGSVLVGTSVNSSSTSSSSHAVRLVNGGPMQFIANPGGGGGACTPLAVDSGGNVLLSCDTGVFLYSAGGVATPVNWATGGSVYDFSLDGKVIVGTAGDGKAVRQASGVTTSYGPFLPSGDTRLYATSGDGSSAVGAHHGPGVTGNGYVAIRWTGSTGLTALTALSNWIYTSASDVSTDGKVIVGWASAESEILFGQIAVKWSGGSLTPTALGPAAGQAGALGVNKDGSVIVGYQGGTTEATLWDSAGAHTIKSLLGATPDLTSDWTLDSAVAVSDDGKFVVGYGTHQNHREAWVVHLP